MGHFSSDWWQVHLAILHALTENAIEKEQTNKLV
jgi:hypothetical protein